ncbi:MAG: cytochrome c biogenesis protein ResB [Desulfobacterales bacterium]
MKKTSAKAGMMPFHKLWHFFISVKLTVVVLLCLAATSIIGTLIPQNQSPVVYFNEYGPTWYRVFSMLDLFDMYHSWWFIFLLLLLFLNISACSLNRLSVTWKRIFKTPMSTNPAVFKKYKNRIEFTDERPVGALSERYRSVIAGRFGKYAFEENSEGFSLFAEKNRWTRLGVYIVHAGVILLLIGGMIGAKFGFDGFVTLPEGESINHVRLKDGSGILPLGFEIRLDDFRVSFYDSGAPKEYLSALTIIENGTPLFTRNVIVNDPLRFRGINIYQSSYGRMQPEFTPVADIESKKLVINITNTANSMTSTKELSIGETIDLPEGRGTFTLREYLSGARFRGRHVHEAFVGVVAGDDGSKEEILLPLRFPNFDKMRNGYFYFSLENIADLLQAQETKPRFYSGLQITYDPGVPVVYAGFVLILIGCYISFFMSHRQIAVQVRPKDGVSHVIVTGTADKNKLDIKKHLEKVSTALSARPTSSYK